MADPDHTGARADRYDDADTNAVADADEHGYGYRHAIPNANRYANPNADRDVNRHASAVNADADRTTAHGYRHTAPDATATNTAAAHTAANTAANATAAHGYSATTKTDSDTTIGCDHETGKS